MNLKDRARLELDENQMTNSNDTVEKWKQLLEETTELLKKEKVNHASLKREKQKLQEQVAKLVEEKKELQEEIDVWRDESKREASWTKYYKDKLEDEERHSNWMANHIRELNEEISNLRNRPLWKWIWNDIKPKMKYTYNHYSKEYRWKKFLGKVFRVSLAVLYAVGVFSLWWNIFV